MPDRRRDPDALAAPPPTRPVGRTGPATGGGAADAGIAVGIGLRPGTPAATILAGIDAIVGPRRITCLATLDSRAIEPGVREAAAGLGVPLRAYPADVLAAVPVPNPAPRESLPSVAEAAAALAGGGDLVVPKTPYAGVVTVAAAAAEPDPPALRAP